jgi:hypothetical protein
MTSMEDQFVNFKIITRNNKGNKYRRWALGVVVISMSFIFIYDEPVPATVTLIVLGAMFGLTLFLGIKAQLAQEHDELGWVMLAVNYIVVRLGDEEVEYSIDKTTTMSVELWGYAGEPIIGQYTTAKKGYDNFISLTNETGTVRHEVLVSNKMKILILDRLVSSYRRRGVVVKYNGQTSEFTDRSLIQRLLFAIRN